MFRRGFDCVDAMSGIHAFDQGGFARILAALKALGLRLAVASSTREVTVRDQLGRAGLLPYFDEVITGDMVTHGKPDPEIYLTACRALGLPPEECLGFEDSVNGIRSAYKAGLYTVQVPDVQKPGTESNALSWRTFASLTEAEAYFRAYLA